MYAACRTYPDPQDLIPDSICGDSFPVPRSSWSPAKEGAGAIRGAVLANEAAPKEGFGELLRSGTGDVLDQAVRRLELSAAADPENAQTWNQLAAVYLTRAERLNSPRDLLRFYEAADRAVRLDGSLLKARFNRALALERLYLAPAATAAWDGYLELEQAPGWRKEAEERHERLVRPDAAKVWKTKQGQLDAAALAGDAGQVRRIVAQNRQAAREYAEFILFGAWGDAEAAGDSRAAADKLRILRSIGDTLARVNGERFVQDAVAALDEVQAGGDAGRQARLVQACRDLRDAYEFFYDRQTGKARSKLTGAWRTFSELGSPLALRAEIFLVSVDYIEKDYLRAAQKLDRLIAVLQGTPYAALRGQAIRTKGTLEGVQGRLSPAIEHYQQAVAIFEGLGEIEAQAAAEVMLGEALTMVGRGEEAWQYIYSALRATPKVRDQNALVNIFMTAGNAALRDGQVAAALAFQEERVRRVPEKNDVAAVEALSWLARIQDHMGDRDAALESLRKAESHLLRMDEKNRKQKQADLDMIKGTILADREPENAIGLLSRALAVHGEDHNLVFTLWTLLPRGRAYRQIDDFDRAERDLKEALSLYDRMGESLNKEDLRLALLQEMDAAFDEMVALQAERGDTDRAFAYADRAHTQVLPGSASKLWTEEAGETKRLLAAEPEPLPIADIRRRIPKGVTLVQYHVLEDRVLIWVLASDSRGKAFFVQPIRRADLETQVAKLLELKPETWQEEADRLFDLLVRPWLPDVPANGKIVLIPDKVLQRVPFAALRDKDTGKLLVRDHLPAYAPSATLYVNSLQRQRGTPLNLANGLVVGEPAVDRTLFAGLPALQAAKDEANQLVLATSALPLTGAAADEASFLAGALNAEWIHFAGHSLVDSRNTLLSKLVLAPGQDGDTGELTAQEIYSLKLPKTRLVVLAACETGNQFVPGGEGVTSLARAFQSAGVPTVVASLWSVDDKATARLFELFYANLRKNADPVEALGKAQREMLVSPEYRSPRAWAAFTVIGASAN
ncbi:MAG: CHAT domain-containing protein [Thermoanaerobaculia bacterium]